MLLEHEGAFSGLNQIPGPGTYAPEKSMKGYEAKRGFSMASKYDVKQNMATPGPGTYTRKREGTTSIAMGKSQRDNAMITKDQISNPGPGTYKKKQAFNQIGGVI